MNYEDIIFRVPTKEEQKQNQIDNLNKVQIGDIYVNSWGYEQTNIDFYQVIKKSGKSVYFKQINSKVIENNYDRGYCVPIKDDFIVNSKEFRRVVSKSKYNYFSMNSYSGLTQHVEGDKYYFSTYA